MLMVNIKTINNVFDILICFSGRCNGETKKNTIKQNRHSSTYTRTRTKTASHESKHAKV